MNSSLISQIFFFLAIISGFLTVIGLIRPGFVVWWSEKKSRGSVFAVWGALLVICCLGYWLTHSKDNDTFKEGSMLKNKPWKVRLYA